MASIDLNRLKYVLATPINAVTHPQWHPYVQSLKRLLDRPILDRVSFLTTLKHFLTKLPLAASSCSPEAANLLITLAEIAYYDFLGSTDVTPQEQDGWVGVVEEVFRWLRDVKDRTCYDQHVGVVFLASRLVTDTHTPKSRFATTLVAVHSVLRTAAPCIPHTYDYHFILSGNATLNLSRLTQDRIIELFLDDEMSTPARIGTLGDAPTRVTSATASLDLSPSLINLFPFRLWPTYHQWIDSLEAALRRVFSIDVPLLWAVAAAAGVGTSLDDVVYLDWHQSTSIANYILQQIDIKSLRTPSNRVQVDEADPRDDPSTIRAWNLLDQYGLTRLTQTNDNMFKGVILLWSYCHPVERRELLPDDIWYPCFGTEPHLPTPVTSRSDYPFPAAPPPPPLLTSPSSPCDLDLPLSCSADPYSLRTPENIGHESAQRSFSGEALSQSASTLKTIPDSPDPTKTKIVKAEPSALTVDQCMQKLLDDPEMSSFLDLFQASMVARPPLFGDVQPSNGKKR